MIPKILHQFWDGGELPAQYAEYCLGWKDLHPGWKYRLWDTYSVCSVLEIKNRTLMYNAARISPNATLQFISDVVRYELLYAFGGVWLDVDIKPQKPLDSLCVVQAWITWEQTGVWVNNAAMACQQAHPWVAEIRDNLAENVKKFPASAANTHKSGPQFITPITKKHAAVEIYPQEYFFPYSWNQLDREDESFLESFGVHRWNNRRKRSRK